MDGKLVFASPAQTAKVRNIQRTGRAGLTVINLDTRRYVTVEGPASFEPWQDTPAHIKRLKDLYIASARPPKGPDEEFAQQMRKEERGLVFVTSGASLRQPSKTWLTKLRKAYQRSQFKGTIKSRAHQTQRAIQGSVQRAPLLPRKKFSGEYLATHH